MPLRWSSCVLSTDGTVVESANADLVLPTASVGKVFLLCEAAQQIIDGRLDPLGPLHRDTGLAVADSGLWQHLAQGRLPLVDVCVLVAAVSDNWATNVLLDTIGLDAVADRAEALGCVASRLEDAVRDARGPDDRPTLSRGTTRELAGTAHRIHRAARGQEDQGLAPDAARLVERWLRTGVDLTLVADAFALDPLAHADGAPHLWNKTGWDEGVRADMGVVASGATSLAYAATLSWQPGDCAADVVSAPFRELGARLHQSLPC